MFFSIDAYDAVNETHIFAKYRFRALFYILVFYNRPIFKKSIRGQTRGSQRSKRGQFTQNWKIYLFMHFFWCKSLIYMKKKSLDLYFTF